MSYPKSDRIRCPKCKTIQGAVITFEDWMPFPCYVHNCTDCGYIIMESEWDSIGNKPTEQSQ